MNPRMTVKRIISEPLMTHHVEEYRQDERIDELLSLVPSQQVYRDRYPHEFSGGQRQRICIARALALNRVYCGREPVAALDVFDSSSDYQSADRSANTISTHHAVYHS